MVQVRNLTKAFTDDTGRFEVLRDLSFTINKGEMVALVGASGAGKTTLLQIVGALDLPTSGSVEITGKSLTAMKPDERALFRNTAIGFVFQFHHLLPDFTALENVMMPGLIAGRGPNVCEDEGRRILELVGIARRFHSHYPAELSGGERQRVALARALFNKPALILADEPTGNLDNHNGGMLLNLFKKANEELSQTFLVATHNSDLAGGLHRALYLSDGQVHER
ncbi:MAG: ABC transporter ATP-binding protein [Chitinivibrionales bacterium]|nr:ABC transporter ATP-binding protein [Chitinivibrionales bacterium]